jgi:hypothetical protein
MRHENDIVVVGAGIAGFAAAIAAAESGRTVCLIEKSTSLGGDSVNTNVGTICGAYYRTFSGIPKLSGYAFSRAFLNALTIADDVAKPYLHTNGLYIIPYEWRLLHTVYENFLKERNVDVRLGTTLQKVYVEEKRITKLGVEQQGKLFTGEIRAVIDCSGSAIVSRLAGLETISENSYQAAAQVFRITGVESRDEFSLNMVLRRAVLKLHHENNWPVSYKALSVVPGSLRNKKADLKLTLPETITDNQNEIDALYATARRRVEDVFSNLKKEIVSLQNSSLETIFPQPGIRVLQRSRGKYVLTEHDVLTCKRFKDGVANGTWPIEAWNTDGKLSMNYFEPDNAYSIPADCLMAAEINNLFFAGKNISATSQAIASARVMGTGLQTGYAAGKLACVSTDVEQQQIIAALQHELE